MSGRLLSIRDAAAYVGVPYLRVYRWIKNGVLPFVQVGDVRRYYIDRADLDTLIEKSKRSEAA